MFLFWLFCSLIWKDGTIGIDVAWHPSFIRAQRGLLSEVRGSRWRRHVHSFFPMTSADAAVSSVYSWRYSRAHELKSHPYFYFFLTVQSKDDQIQVIGNLKNISMASSKLLLAAKSLSVDPGAANAKNLLAVAARCENTQKSSTRSLHSLYLKKKNKQEC